MVIDRNTVEVFIQRTRINLKVIEDTYANSSKGHVVTQLVNSLLGIVVYPWEHQGLGQLKARPMTDIGPEGWPDQIVEVGKDKSKTVGQFIHRMRNAIAHGYIEFSSDAALNEVTLVFEDRLPKNQHVHWRARIEGKHLRQFCDLLMN